jgi:uncharacterized protein (DUF1330 family)
MKSPQEKNEKSMAPVAYAISGPEGFIDEVAISRYGELASPAIERFGGQFILSNDEAIVVSGEWLACRFSTVDFPSIEVAKAWSDPCRRRRSSSEFGAYVSLVVEHLNVRLPPGRYPAS